MCNLLAAGWTERLLKSLYYVTQAHGDAFPAEVERLWSTVAETKHNIIPILDFIITYGIRESAPGVGHTTSRSVESSASALASTILTNPPQKGTPCVQDQNM